LAFKFTYYFKLIRDGKYLLFLGVIEQLFFFLVFLAFARKFSVEAYGQLITLFTVANVFAVLLNFGLPVLNQREIAAAGRDKNGITGKILSLNLLLFVLYFLFTFSYYKIFYSSLSFKLFFLTAVPVYLYSNINILNSVFTGLGKYKKSFFALLNARIITISVFAAGIVWFRFSLYYLLVVYSAGFVFQILLLILGIRKEGVSPALKIGIKELSPLIKLSFPLGMAVAFNYFYDKIDILLISKLTDYTQVGFYNIGYGIFKASSAAFSFLLVSGLTRVSYLSRSKHAVKLFFRKNIPVFLAFGIVISVILFFFSGTIIGIIYTEKFLPSALILRIASFAVIGLALNNLTGVILNGLGLYRENMYVTFTGLLVNVILNFVFIPLYGIVAAAVITVLTEYFIFAGDYYFIKQHLK